MRYTYYVVYMNKNGFGTVFITHDKKYDTANAIMALQDYIKTNYQKGKDVIILSLILLDGELEE